MEAILTGESMRNAEIKMMSLNEIKLAKNSRLKMSGDDLSGLMQSIKEVGLLQPIGVSKNGTGYSICYGNRRFLACSKLGMKKVPVVIHNHKDQDDEDLKNLTENIQRRNISLVEAGRYITLLSKKMNQQEIAVRLGVTKSYVKATIDAYGEVPKRFRDDIEVSVTKDGKHGKVSRGKVAITTAQKILSACKTRVLNPEQRDYLFEQAKLNDKFSPQLINTYAKKLSAGDKDPVGNTSKPRLVNIQFLISESEHERLCKKHVDDGPFQGLQGLFKAVLQGEISERVKILKTV